MTAIADRGMTVARAFALVFGAVYVLVGILGVIPGITPDADPHDKLLGLFAINWFHNLAHLLIGVAGLAASRQHDMSRIYAQAVGIAYAGLFVIGLFTDDFLDILPLNAADDILHLLSAIVALVIGFTDIGRRLVSGRPATA